MWADPLKDSRQLAETLQDLLDKGLPRAEEVDGHFMAVTPPASEALVDLSLLELSKTK